MYNLRYHLASLVSVFLALALGLVLGGLVVDSAPSTSQDTLIASLKDEFTQIRAESSQRAEDNENLATYATMLTSQVVAGQLTGDTVVVLGTKNGAMSSAADDVSAAGAVPFEIVIRSDRFDPTDAERESTALIAQIKSETGANSDITAVASGLYAEWTAEDSTKRPLTDALVADGVLVTPKVEGSFPVFSGLVNTALAGEGVDELALAVSKMFSSASYPTVGASMFHGADKVALASWDTGVSATNMLGSPIGTYSLVAILKGAEQGLYGSMDASSALYPEMPVSKVKLPVQNSDKADSADKE